jgi:HK97 family phage prohead protease
MQREHIDVLDVRLASVGEDGTLAAIAVRFDVLDSYGTTFDRNAFGNLSKRRLPMLWSHMQDQVIGSWSDFTASDRELRATGRLNLEIGRAKEVRAMLMSEDIAGVSIGFETIKAEARAGGVRHITKAIIHEISLVALPSVPGARVTSVRHTVPDLSGFIRATRRATQTLRGKD